MAAASDLFCQALSTALDNGYPVRVDFARIRVFRRLSTSADVRTLTAPMPSSWLRFDDDANCMQRVNSFAARAIRGKLTGPCRPEVACVILSFAVSSRS